MDAEGMALLAKGNWPWLNDINTSLDFALGMQWQLLPSLQATGTRKRYTYYKYYPQVLPILSQFSQCKKSLAVP